MAASNRTLGRPSPAAAALCALLLPAIAGAAEAPAATVTVAGMRFEPQTVTVKPGGSVVWVNAEKRTNHSVLFEALGWESDRFFPGESVNRVFDRPGRYPYRCGPHPEMTGVVEVVP